MRDWHPAEGRCSRQGKCFAREIVAVHGLDGDNNPVSHTVHEGIRFDETPGATKAVKLLLEQGRLTAAASSQICNGAPGVPVVNEAGLKKPGVDPIARSHSLTVKGEDPVVMLEAPINATRAALKRAGMTIDQIDPSEVNKAFASVPMARARAPGAPGTKLMATLVHALHARGGCVTLRIFESLKPVIGAINGAAVGVGVTMQLPMDVRIASDTAKFGFVFARRGIVPEACSSWFLPRLVGISRAMEWCATGRVFSAQEALEGGLVRQVVPAGQPVPAAIALAREIADNTAPVSVALTRQMLWRMLGADHPMEAHKLDSRAIFARGRQGDAKEGVVSFLEKRPASYPDKVSADMPDFSPGGTSAFMSEPVLSPESAQKKSPKSAQKKSPEPALDPPLARCAGAEPPLPQRFRDAAQSP